jgi:hypothetical protein
LLDAVKAAKDSLSNAVAALKGEAPQGLGDVGGEVPPEGDMGIEPSMGGDQFGMANAASGEEELPTGRELK